MEKTSITKEQIAADLASQGIRKGDMLNLKISLKSIGNVEGGAAAVIDAFLETVGPEGTLVADSFVRPFLLYKKSSSGGQISGTGSMSYAGAVTNEMIKREDSFRSSHPIQSFTAIGKFAKKLTEEFTIDSEPYGFLKEMALMGAKNIRIGGKDKVVGVGTTHIAICELGLKQRLIPRGIYYIDQDGKKKLFKAGWANGCPDGFNDLLDNYRENGLILNEGMVGNAECIITSMKETLDYEMDLFQKDPGAFLCKDPLCHFCSFNWKASKYTFIQSCINALKKKDLRKVFSFIKIKFLGKDHPE